LPTRPAGRSCSLAGPVRLPARCWSCSPAGPLLACRPAGRPAGPAEVL